MKGRLLASLIVLFSGVSAYGQDSLNQLLDLSIEKLMDIPIYSVSKAEETSFEAPLSSSVLTRDQIKRSGCTSIMEALRLVPGVIVREQTNGNYDIHIRGLDNVPPNSSLLFFTNSTTLVMIDNRPVYNYLHGGTFWETLPVTLTDVEKIEVVRGPSAAIYGPNAVSGVINIITRQAEKAGPYVVANAEYGSYNSLLTSAAVGYKAKDKFSAVLSGSFQNRERTSTTYYDVRQNAYVPLDSVTAIKTNPLNNTSESYPNPERALRRRGLNAFLNYDPKKKIHLGIALGLQESEAQKEFGSGLMPITTATSSTKYADVKASLYGFDVQVSHLTGHQSPVLGQKIWQWDLNTTDVVAEYNFNGIKNLSIRPGIMYRLAIYDDSKYVNAAAREGLWSGEAKSETKAASLRLDYKMLEKKLRIIAAGRIDQFNYPSKNYFSYQLAATYKLNDNNLIRAVQSRANRAPLLIDVYSNLDLKGTLSATQTYLLQFRGNKEIRLLTSDLTEIGFRSKLNENLSMDIEAFYSRSKDFSNVIFETGTFNSTGPVGFTGLADVNNIRLRTQQMGATVAMDYTVGDWQFKPFITVQQTDLIDYSPYANAATGPPTAANNFNPAVNNVNSNPGTTIRHQATPSIYGGAYINWAVNERFNVNVNGYFYSDHTQLEENNLTYKDGYRGVQQIGSKLLLNLAAMYRINKQFTVHTSFRNMLNSRFREFYKGDEPAYMIFGGLNYEL
ncbi:MAG: TonB-dependent receptor plug domain-containing protein [Bacteroidota bacterium]